LGVLLSLMLGISRTAFSMAANRELPVWLAAVHPKHKVPHHAEIAVAIMTCAIVMLGDIRGAIGFSAFTVLLYYAITNASAWTLAGHERIWPRWLCAAGLIGCPLLAFSLPAASVARGIMVMALGAALYIGRKLCKIG
jgi:APA family basic amino acid/polyamine antiporter